MPLFSLVRSARRKKTISLNVQDDGSLRVLAPARTPLRWIEDFVARQGPRLRKRMARFPKGFPKGCAAFPENGDSVPFAGTSFRLSLTEGREGLDGNILFLCATPQNSASALRLWYRQQARRLLPDRAQKWAEKTGLHPAKIVVADAQKRWGSCSSANVIRLNWRLVMLPDDLADYVIVHEISHILHKNHSPAFWRTVEKNLPGSKEKRKKLRLWEKGAVRALALGSKDR